METTIRQKIGELVGKASMCWSELPGGVFETERAKRIVDDIMNIIESPHSTHNEVKETKR